MYPSAYLWTGLYPHHHHQGYSINPDPNPMHHSDNQKPKEIPLPYGSNAYYCFPPPPIHHGHCCNHSYFGGGVGSYSFPPPYFPQCTPLPAFQNYGGYYPPPPPPFPGPYHPAPSYSVPNPPHYSIEQQPRYDYGKNNLAPPNHHRCCGCSHHRAEDDDDKLIKIQQSHQEPQLEKKTNDSLAPPTPFLFKDCPPYPIMWLPPPGYMKTESKSTTDKDDKDDSPPVSFKKHLEPPPSKLPVELGRDQQAGDAKGFPFPIFWLPSSNNHEMVKDPNAKNNVDLASHNGPPDKEKGENRKNDDDLGSEDAESETISTKHVVQKVIPVKQLGTDKEKKSTLKSIEPKAKPDDHHHLEKAVGKDSPKTSKLPPVCLRIDPIPRKNKKSSRSPSPPAPIADKERSKSSLQQRQLSEEEDMVKSKEEQSKGKIKTIDVADDADNKVQKDIVADHGNKVQTGEEKTVMAQGQSSKDEPYIPEEGKKNIMSVNEAALIIQSVYRGFEVRKSQPLVKLRQISQVRKQVVELTMCIQDSCTTTRGINEKQKLIIGETIMSLLLKLDTIQGLHPIVRDIRKSVAKELVGLQEKLDSLLTLTKSETPIEETMSSTQLVTHPEHVSSIQSDGNVKLVESEAASESHNDDDDGGAGGECNVNNLETQLEVHNNEKGTEEVTNNQIQVSLETKQPPVDDDDDDAIQEKFGKDLVLADKIDEEVGSDTCVSDNHDEAQATDLLHDAQGMKPPDPLLEENTQELLKDNQLQTSENDATLDKCDQLQAGDPDNDVEMMESVFDNREVQVMEFEEEEDGCTKASDMKVAPEMEPQSMIYHTQVETSEIEHHPVGQVMFDGDVENVASSEHHPSSVEAEEEEVVDDDGGGNVQTILDRGGGGDVVSMEDEMKPKKDAANVVVIQQEDYNVTREEAPPKANDYVVESSTEAAAIMEDLGGGEELRQGVSGDRKQLMEEENEKLRMAVEELMKAGKEQLGVIRDLTARLKDMEKKKTISKNNNKKKKKKIKVNKCNKSSRFCSERFGVEDDA